MNDQGDIAGAVRSFEFGAQRRGVALDQRVAEAVFVVVVAGQHEGDTVPLGNQALHGSGIGGIGGAGQRGDAEQREAHRLVDFAVDVPNGRCCVGSHRVSPRAVRRVAILGWCRRGTPSRHFCTGAWLLSGAAQLKSGAPGAETARETRWPDAAQLPPA